MNVLRDTQNLVLFEGVEAQQRRAKVLDALRGLERQHRTAKKRTRIAQAAKSRAGQTSKRGRERASRIETNDTKGTES